MLIQPFVENAVEHGVQMKEGKGLVTVSFELKNTLLNISIKDDGPGMSEKTKANSSHNSLSIQIINERLELLAKRKNNEPAITIHSKEKLGTLVELSFPVA
ncbi:MAG: hypothetical protein M0D57_09520 [Sphingobacteriales bacterium JAD_PAG50586_3]|nr:MAG: hypothetical protein M0D57_09520 [Sphingobacteriales bacterium JAD_PAG50586_3]